ncbi:hypothetical protein WMY93_001809 [Mugilogobius chulae]|uniref:Serine/threonine-protein kinase 1 n=1 Tax=Mugilogobius chulae TaxID=88201 RepID=A0AAW0PRZ6_9GOBI
MVIPELVSVQSVAGLRRERLHCGELLHSSRFLRFYKFSSRTETIFGLKSCPSSMNRSASVLPSEKRLPPPSSLTSLLLPAGSSPRTQQHLSNQEEKIFGRTRGRSRKRSRDSTTSGERACRKRKSSSEDSRPSKRSRKTTSPQPAKCKAKEKRKHRLAKDGSTESKIAAEKEEPCRQEEEEEEPPVKPKSDQTSAESAAAKEDSPSTSKEKQTPPVNNYAQREFNYRYTTIKSIATGGFGEVYSGIRNDDKRLVAIKRIPRRKVEYVGYDFNMLLNPSPLEVRLLDYLGAGVGDDSSHITPVLLDWYDLGNEVVLVFERPEPCMDLEEYLKWLGPIKLDHDKARDIFRQLLDAAIEMEDNQIFHRDIKPTNVLIETGSERLRARFIDFGCGTMYKSGQIFWDHIGTPRFFPPEMIRGHSYKPGPTTVWQLGVLLYYMLFKKRPQYSNRAIASPVPVPVPHVIPPDCRDLLQSCLEKDPNMRPTLKKLKTFRWLKTTSSTGK